MRLLFFLMKQHYTPPKIFKTTYGETYKCDHPVYTYCTLFRMWGKGLAIIQQRYSSITKHTWWGEIDPWLNDDLYLHPKFIKYFNEHAGRSINGLYPTVTIRQIMWALRMHPIKREKWETVFDHKNI